MANTTKRKTTKANAEKVVEEVVINEVPVEEPPVKKKSTPPKQAKKFSPTDLIECRSVTAGELIMVGKKSQLQYTWADYGDTAWVEYQDLQAAQSMRSGFLVKPRFIIMDEDLIELWGNMLKPIYDRIDEESIEGLFDLVGIEFERKLEKLPKGVVDSVKTKASAMIQSGELYDIRKIKSLDKVLGTEFMLMIG